MDNKLSQNDLANLINSTQAYISEIEAGKHRLFLDTALSITQALNIPIDYLVADFKDSHNVSTQQSILYDIRNLNAKQLELLRIQINFLKNLNI